MLILTRSQDEFIMIGGVVKVMVLGMKGGQVRIGIDAPESVKILRGELFDAGRSDRDSDEPQRDSFQASR